MRKGSVAIATLKLLTLARKFVSDYRRQYAIELSKLLLDLGYKAAWFQPGNGWHSQLLPEVPVYGVLPDGASFSPGPPPPMISTKKRTDLTGVSISTSSWPTRRSTNRPSL